MPVNEKLRQGFSIIINSSDADILNQSLIYLSRNNFFPHQIILYSNKADFKTKKFIENSGYVYRISNAKLPAFTVYDDCLDLCSKEYILLFNEEFIALPRWDTLLVYTIENMDKDPEKGIFVPTIIEPIVKLKDFSLPLNYGESPETFRYNDLCKDLPYITEKIKTSTTNILPILIHKDLYTRFLEQSIFSQILKESVSPLSLIEKTINENLKEDEFPAYTTNIKDSIFYFLKKEN